MRPVLNAVIGCSVLPIRKSSRSRLNSSTTCGVIHPPHTLSRGKRARSMTTTSSPDWRSFQAHEEPAGPPPMMMTSVRVTIIAQLPGGRAAALQNGRIAELQKAKDSLQKGQKVLPSDLSCLQTSNLSSLSSITFCNPAMLQSCNCQGSRRQGTTLLDPRANPT